MKKNLHIVIIAACFLTNCRHDKNADLSVKKTYVDQIAGMHTWHGSYAFDKSGTPISNKEMAIVKVNDSTISITGDPTSTFSFNSVSLTYLKTDSQLGQVIYGPGPLYLYYYYKTGNINLQLHQSGVHSDDLDMWTP